MGCCYLDDSAVDTSENMKSYKSTLLRAACSLLLMFWTASTQSEELYFIDAHSQVDSDISLEDIVGLMKEAGISKTILAARGKRKSRDVAELAESYPDQVVAAVRTKSKHYINNTQKYYQKLSKQLKSGRYNAMAEILLYHAQKGDRAGKVEVYPDDERVQFAFRNAEKYVWPFIIHIEFAALSGSQREKYFSAMEMFLAQHPDHPIALIHMGQLPAADAKRLIEKHANIYFLTSHCNPVAISQSNQPWVNLFTNDELAPEWKSLITENPTRFVFALDNVWPEQWHNGYKEQVTLWRNALSRLPPEVAHAVAHSNAEVLWRLK